MRLAVSLTAVVLSGYALLAPILPLASVESKLPACCRGDGKHRCGMTPEPEKQSSGPVLQASRCGQFPNAVAVPARSGAGLAVSIEARSIALPLLPGEFARATETPRPAPFGRTNQERGPPSFSFA